jgi:hypothetical protein
MITSTCLCGQNSIVIPRLGFPFSKIFFSKFSFQIFKIRGRSELSDLQGNFGKNLRIFGDKVWPASTLLSRPACPWALFDSIFSHCILLVERSTIILWNGKILRKRGVLSLLIPQLTSFFLTSLPRLLFILSHAMDPFNALSTTVAARKIAPLKEASPTKVMSCALIALTDLQKDLDAAKEVIGGASAPSVKMASRPAMVCGQSIHHDEGRTPPAL